MQNKNLAKVTIRNELYQEMERLVEQSDQFDNVSDYVNFVLQEVLFGQDDSDHSDEQDEMVRKRLRDLGYL
ncbi:hypothetical protein MJD09_21885 [bacterium]|nr:hypothetical protein [bacterium]